MGKIYKEKKQLVQKTSFQRVRAKRYDHLYRQFSSILKKITLYAINKKIYVWRGRYMSRQNCPKKLKALLTGKILRKYELDFLLKKNTQLILPPKSKPNPQLVRLNAYFNQNEINKKRGQQETQKFVQMIKDHLPIIPHLFRYLFRGSKSISSSVASQLNCMFKNFELGNEKFKQNIPPIENWIVEKLMSPYEKELIQREQKLLKQGSQIQWKQVEEQEAKLTFQSLGYNKYQVFASQSQYLQKEQFFLNAMQMMCKLVKQYVGQFYSFKNQAQLKIKKRFIPTKFNAETLKSNMETEASQIVQNIQSQVMKMAQGNNQSFVRQQRKDKKVMKKPNLTFCSTEKIALNPATQILKQQVQKLSLNNKQIRRQDEIFIETQQCHNQSYHNDKSFQISEFLTTIKRKELKIHFYRYEGIRPSTCKRILRLYECGMIPVGKQQQKPNESSSVMDEEMLSFLVPTALEKQIPFYWENQMSNINLEF